MFAMTEGSDFVLIGKKSREVDLPSFLKPFEILSRFEEAYQQIPSLNKTQLQVLTNLRWDSLNNYLGWMIDRKMIQTNNDGKVKSFRLTEKGRRSLYKLAVFLDSLK